MRKVDFNHFGKLGSCSELLLVSYPFCGRNVRGGRF